MSDQANEVGKRVTPAAVMLAVGLLAMAATFFQVTPPRNIDTGKPGIITLEAAGRAGATVSPTNRS